VKREKFESSVGIMNKIKYLEATLKLGCAIEVNPETSYSRYSLDTEQMEEINEVRKEVKEIALLIFNAKISSLLKKEEQKLEAV